MKTVPKVRAHKTPNPSVADPLALAAGGKRNERLLHSLELVRKAQAETPSAVTKPKSPRLSNHEESAEMSLCAEPRVGLLFSHENYLDGPWIVEKVIDGGRVVGVNDAGTRVTVDWDELEAAETPSENGFFVKLAPIIAAAMDPKGDTIGAAFLREQLRKHLRAEPNASDAELAILLQHATENAAELQELLNRWETVRQVIRECIPSARAPGEKSAAFELEIARDIRAFAADRPAISIAQPIASNDPFMTARSIIRGAVASVENAVEAAGIEAGDDDLSEVRNGWLMISPALINLSDERAHQILNRVRQQGGGT